MAVDPAVKAARGTKRMCLACETRFYDLGRSPIICPSCTAEFVPVTRRAAEAASRAGWSGGNTRGRPIAAEAADAPEQAEEVAELEGEVKDDVEAEGEAGAPEDEILLEETEEDNVDPAVLVDPEADVDER
jgi:uncharacterized protein (TIGR02300 family)